MNPLLNAKGLSHSFETTLYTDINLCIYEGESVAIMGVSGSGKSTLLNNLSTLLPPKSGQVGLLGNDDIYALSAKEQLLLRRLHIGIVFQAHYLFRGFSGIENQSAYRTAKRRATTAIINRACAYQKTKNYFCR